MLQKVRERFKQASKSRTNNGGAQLLAPGENQTKQVKRLKQSARTAPQKVFVLSLDGGGIRGIVPAMVLQELEQLILEHQETAQLYHKFDLIAGTGTGGLLALGLSAPVTTPTTTLDLHRPFTPRELIETYEALGKEVFPKGKFRMIGQAFTGKYSATVLEKLLQTTFGNATQKELLTNVVVTSYDHERKRPHLFMSPPQGRAIDATLDPMLVQNTQSGQQTTPAKTPTEAAPKTTTSWGFEFYLHQIARAATATPTYFSPALLSDSTGAHSFSLCDGSIFANNPTLVAYSRALELFPHANEIHILSLGTAPKRTEFSHAKIRDWGFLDWLNPAKGTPLQDVHSHAQAGIIDYYAAHLPKLHYYRVDMDQQHTNISIDSILPEDIQAVHELGGRMIEKHRPTLRRFVEQL